MFRFINDNNFSFKNKRILKNFFKGAASSVVKKKYRELSKTMHPDKGGDPVQFDRIAKAYQALTDDESRENWEKYGNPDGPTGQFFWLIFIYIYFKSINP